MRNRKIALVGFVLKTATIAVALTSNAASSRILLQSNDGIRLIPRNYPRALSAAISESNEEEAKRDNETKPPSPVLEMASFLASKLLEKALKEASKEEKDSKMTTDDLIRLMEAFQSTPMQQQQVQDKQSVSEEVLGQDSKEEQQEVQIPTVEKDETLRLDVASENVDGKNESAIAGSEDTNESNEIELDIQGPQIVKDDEVFSGGQEEKDYRSHLSVESTNRTSEDTTSDTDPKETDPQLVPSTSDPAEDIDPTIDGHESMYSDDALDGEGSMDSDGGNAEDSQVTVGTAVMIPSDVPDETDERSNIFADVSPNEMASNDPAGQYAVEKADDTETSPSSAHVAEANLTDDGDNLVEDKPARGTTTSLTDEEEPTLVAVDGEAEKAQVSTILRARIPDVISKEYGRSLEVIASNIPPLRQAYARKSPTPPFVIDDSTSPTPEPSASPSTPPSTSLRSTADSMVEELPVAAHEKIEEETKAFQVVGGRDEAIFAALADDIATQRKEFESLSDYKPQGSIPETEVESSRQELEGPETGRPIHIPNDSSAANEPWFAETTLEVTEKAISDDFVEEQPSYLEDGDSYPSLLADLKKKFTPFVKNERQGTQGAASVDTSPSSSLDEIPHRRRKIGTRFRSNVENLFRRRRGDSGDASRSSPGPFGGSRETRAVSIAKARLQPKPADEELRLAERYGKMDLEERAFTILYDLGMIETHPNPDDAEYDES